jgi:zinc transport system ATP-binding protein
MNNKQVIIEISGLSYSYEKENVLEEINLSITKGSFLGIVGPNGSGKSTLLKLILGLEKKQKDMGRIYQNRKRLSVRKQGT